MDTKEIRMKIGDLMRLEEAIEDAYVESDGEVTPEAEELEKGRDAVKALLLGEGIDHLGRSLAALQERVAMAKAEKKKAERRVRAYERSVDFINDTIVEVLKATGREKAKGDYYGFTAYVSEHTSVDTGALDSEFLAAATEAARNAGLPGWVDIELVTNTKRIREWAETHEGEGEEYLVTETGDAVRFTKPRKPKED